MVQGARDHGVHSFNRRLKGKQVMWFKGPRFVHLTEIRFMK